jgi:hypothetical protein
MLKHLAGIYFEVRARAALCGPCPLFFLPRSGALRKRSGQTTVEYLLMLAVVSAVAAMMGILFHKRILGGIFTLVGMIIGAGTPK